MINIYLVDNKYSRWYFNIIENAKNRIKIDEYFEIHHIIPKSFGGSNDSSNLVKLTYREHFLCHWLLTKCSINTNFKRLAFFALSRMSRTSTNKAVISSWQYTLMKTAVKTAMIGRDVKEETKEKNRKVAYNQKQDPIYMENWNRGMHNRVLPPQTEERKEKARQLRIQYNKSDEHRNIVSNTMAGKPKSKKQKAKQSKIMKEGAAAKGERNGMSNPVHVEKVRQSKIGLVGLYKDNIKKMAKPGTEKWNDLINQGFSPKKPLQT